MGVFSFPGSGLGPLGDNGEGVDFGSTGQDLGAGMAASGLPVAHAVAKHAAAVTGWGVVWSVVTNIVDEVLTAGVTLLTNLQGTNTPGFFDFLQALMSDLLGVDFAPDALSNAWAQGGDVGGITSAGSLLLNQLSSEMNRPLPSPDGPGMTAAKSLLGWMMAFSVREANVSVFTSMIPEEYRFLDGLRDYGVSLARNLGLGRMARLIFQPWLKVAIQDPVTHELNAAYTPTFLGTTQAIKAKARGIYSQSDLEDEAAADGYTLQRLQALTKDTLTQLQESHVWELYKWGAFDQSAALAALTSYGIDPDVVQQYFAALGYKERDTYVPQFLSVIHSQFLNGYLSLDQYQSIVTNLRITQESQQDLLAILGQLASLPRKRLTLAEMQGYYVDGIVDLQDIETYLQLEGYSSDDQDLLVLATLIKSGEESAKLSKAEYAYHKAVLAAVKKAEPPPPPPYGIAAWSPPATSS